MPLPKPPKVKKVKPPLKAKAKKLVRRVALLASVNVGVQRYIKPDLGSSNN